MIQSVRYPTTHEYRAAVEQCLRRMCGKGLDAFPDHDFNADYEDDLRPVESALTALYQFKRNPPPTHKEEPWRLK